MRRREFITLLGSGAAWPLAARAQPPERMRSVGVLVDLPDEDADTKTELAAFRQGLEKRGWPEGDNIRIDYRFAPAGAQAQVLANELIALQPDVIFARSTPVTAAVQQQSRVIPIVFVSVMDPIGVGFIASLARPSGNLTGLMMYEPSVAGEWLEMLTQIAPHLARAALVINLTTAPYYHNFLRAADTVAPSLAIEPVLSPIENDAAEIERAIGSIARIPNGGLIVLPDSTTLAHRDLIIALAARHRLPAVYNSRLWVAAGGLMSYGTNRVEEMRHAAYYVDRILRGDKPGDLPVQAATKFETAVNLKTAKALGLSIPPVLLVAADEVIE